jgi:uncharacterized protein YjbI with pentapeptide repeats
LTYTFVLYGGIYECRLIGAGKGEAMANEEQLAILKQGVHVWNEWQRKPFKRRIDLSKADLSQTNLSQIDLSLTDLSGANLRGADLIGADLRGARLRDADFSGANLTNAQLPGANFSGAILSHANLSNAVLYAARLVGCDLCRAKLSWADLRGGHLHSAFLSKADLSHANLRKTDLSEANLSGANLSEADLTEADVSRVNLKAAYLNRTILNAANLFGSDISETHLKEAILKDADLRNADLTRADITGADLGGAILVGTKIDKAKVSGSSVYGINVWDLEGEFKEQKDLIIARKGQPIITVDNIKVAQFIYLILNNEEIRDVINTLTSKSVLILGRFALPERKAILDALKSKLREYNLLPIVFDFDRPTDKDFTETIKTLAGLSYFVIADITNPKSSPLELQATVPDYQIPFVPIIQEGESPFAMMVDLQKKYNWVLDTLSYSSIETLIKALKPAIIDPAIQKHNELRLIKAREPKIRSANDFIEDKGLE